MDAKVIGILIASVSCSSLAHLALKMGAVKLDATSLLTVATNKWLIGGVALHVLALTLWVTALRQAPLSVAYPFIVMGLVMVGVLSWTVMGEPIGPARAVGYAVIIIGTAIVAAS